MREKLQTTVVMATYNGEKNIIEQLNSLKNQSQKIDEVIIKDDCSTDQTVNIVRRFIEENQLQATWQLIVNEENVGWRKNFFKLLDLASKDVVFTCDQDDIWHEKKIEEMSRTFANQQVQVLVSDYHELVEPGGLVEELKRVDTEKIEGHSEERVVFNENNLFLRRPGCVYAIRQSFIANVMLYASRMENAVHDMSMWGSAVLSNGLFLLRKPLIEWRKHGQSSFKKEIDQANKVTAYQKRLNTLRRRLQRVHAANNYLANLTDIDDFEKKQKMLLSMIDELEMRIAILEKEQLSTILASFFRYKRKFYFGTDIYHLIKYKSGK